MDYLNAIGQYAQNRLDKAINPFTDPAGYVQERFGISESGNAKPVTQTITTDPNTGEQMMTVKGRPEDLSAANPNTPTVTPARPVAPPAAPEAAPAPQMPQRAAQPVSPDQTYQRMIQAESGGRDFNAQGQPLTSPAGAMYSAQVMPQTAANPGYGVRPAQAQTPEEYNRVGQDYYNAMLKKFGTPEAAAAAYNAGPGRVQANMNANQGQLNVAQLPQETQSYLQKVAAPQQPQPQAPQAPAPQAQPMPQPQQRPQMLAGGGARTDVGVSPTEQVVSQLNSTDPNVTGRLAYNENVDPATRQAASSQNAWSLNNQKESQKAEQAVQKAFLDPTGKGGVQMARELAKEKDEGSYIKAYLYARLGLNDLAKSEQRKLGSDNQWTQTLVDGKPSWVLYNGEGAPIKGYNAEGALTPDQLIQTTGSMNKAEVGTQVYADPTGQVPGRYALRRNQGRAEFINTATGAVETNPQVISKLTPLGVAGTIDTAATRAYETRGAGQQGVQAAQGYENAPLPGRPGVVQQPIQQPQPQGPIAPSQPQQIQQQMNGAAQQNARAPQAQPMPQPQGPAQAMPVAGSAPAPQMAQPQAAPPVWAQKQQVERLGKRGEGVDKVIDTEYREQANAGDVVSSVRKEQFRIFDRPGVDADKLFGLYNAAGEGPLAQGATIVRDILGGQFKPEAEVSQRIANLNLTPQEKSALFEYNTMNQKINAQTLKQNSGPGSISDAEQKANREANVDVTKTPALGAYNAIAQSQFTGDIARARIDWAANQNFSNAAQMDKAWRKESQKLQDMYVNISKQRAEYIASRGGNTAAVKEGYAKFPVPEYNPQTESWIKTKPLDQIFKAQPAEPKKRNEI